MFTTQAECFLLTAMLSGLLARGDVAQAASPADCAAYAASRLRIGDIRHSPCDLECGFQMLDHSGFDSNDGAGLTLAQRQIEPGRKKGRKFPFIHRRGVSRNAAGQ